MSGMMKILVLIILFTVAVFAQGNPALDFDGNDDYVNCSNGTDLQMGAHDLTVEFWLKTSTSAVQRIIGNGGTGNSDDGYSIWIVSNGQLRAGFSDGTTSDARNNSNTVNDGNWHHCAVVFDRDGKMWICVDGVCQTKLMGDFSNGIATTLMTLVYWDVSLQRILHSHIPAVLMRYVSGILH